MISSVEFRNSMNSLLVLSSLIWLAGCGPPTISLVPVDGIATLDGEPVKDAGIVFQPIKTGPTASGSTDEQGRFALNTNNRVGVPEGEYIVLISKVQAPSLPKDEQAGLDREKLDDLSKFEPINFLPARYGSIETSELRANVKAGINHFTFSMVSDETVTDPVQNQDEEHTTSHQ